MMIRLSVLIALSLSNVHAWALPKHSPWPGGLGVIQLKGDARPEVTLDDRPALVLRDSNAWFAVVGIPLDFDTAKTMKIRITRRAGEAEELSIDLDRADYRVQRLNVDRKYVEPDRASLDRIFAERKVIDRALGNWRPLDLDSIGLRPPVPGARSSSFGSRRIFNDQPRSPHKGMDITAAAGTPILTPLNGIVSAMGDYYFNGLTVIVDHGQGLVSLYCHLSEIDVEEGQEITPGESLGKVGATGRVTGAHLHFATYLNGTAVDPALLLEAVEP